MSYLSIDFCFFFLFCTLCFIFYHIFVQIAEVSLIIMDLQLVYFQKFLIFYKTTIDNVVIKV